MNTFNKQPQPSCSTSSTSGLGFKTRLLGRQDHGTKGTSECQNYSPHFTDEEDDENDDDTAEGKVLHEKSYIPKGLKYVKHQQHGLLSPKLTKSGSHQHRRHHHHRHQHVAWKDQQQEQQPQSSPSIASSSRNYELMPSGSTSAESSPGVVRLRTKTTTVEEVIREQEKNQAQREAVKSAEQNDLDNLASASTNTDSGNNPLLIVTGPNGDSTTTKYHEPASSSSSSIQQQQPAKFSFFRRKEKNALQKQEARTQPERAILLQKLSGRGGESTTGLVILSNEHAEDDGDEGPKSPDVYQDCVMDFSSVEETNSSRNANTFPSSLDSNSRSPTPYSDCCCGLIPSYISTTCCHPSVPESTATSATSNLKLPYSGICNEAPDLPPVTAHRRNSANATLIRRLYWRSGWDRLIANLPHCLQNILGFVTKVYWRALDSILGVNYGYRVSNGEETERRIRANDPAFNEKFLYANNYIKTSKYTVVTFLPLNLFEQFQRLANFYFLCLLVLQVIPVISSLTPFTTAVPLILVLALTAVKDAYDDFQRHRSDSQVNNRKSLVLRNGHLVEERWFKVEVGDVIRMENDQFVAADVLLLSTSEPNGLCYIETAELDGETNLKCRQCLIETAEMGQEPEKLGSFDGDILCEPPNNHLNRFEGTLTWKGKRYILDNDKVLLRGCILRNTQWCYGVVLFAGRDTKLMQNSGKTKFKRTSIDRLLNFIILGIVFFLLSMCLFCTVACAVWETMIGQYFRIYLPWDALVPQEPIEGAVVISLLVFFSYAIILNTVVPISLYVSVEVIRLLQSFLINWDLKMYHEHSDTPAKARTTTLNEELGQIEYIFSDKTGTLTQNIMTFNKCTIAGKSYGEVIDPKTGEVIENPEMVSSMTLADSTSSRQLHSTTDRKDSIGHTVSLSNASNDLETVESEAAGSNMGRKSARKVYFGSDVAKNEGRPESSEVLQPILSIPLQPMPSDNIKYTLSPIDFSSNPYFEPKFRFYDQNLYDAVKNGDSSVHMFFRHLALCHTVMADERQGNLEYQAQSPDENALVSAARNFEFVFKERTPDSITITAMGVEEVYDLLCILDFNNVRKRMSVVVQKDDKILLLCKGADSIIYERLEVGSVDIKSRTQEHLNKFAGEGLRTLVLAVKELTPEYFEDWKNRHQEAASSLINREEKLDAIYEEIERDMKLIGATAIEDKLQDGVSTCIANLLMAGIKVWVLTGDKQETAINIGYSCQLLTDDMNDIFVVDGASFEDVKTQLLRFVDALQKGSCGPLDNSKMGDVSMVTFSDSEYGPGFHPGDGDSIQDPDGSGSAGEYAVIVNGHSLVHALNPQLESLFLDLASKCKAVICCRVTPLQKALVVELIKKYKKAVTLAIGDGANDVSMIKTAHIGVGISGQEGLQAVLASDYSIAQFRFLERLLLVHGRWSYYRMSKFLRYFFYKNFAFTLTHFWYAFFCGFSAQTVFDPMFISVYNLFYTSMPVLAIGIFDQDCSDENSLRYPKLYTPGHLNLLFNKREFFKSALHGFVTSCVLFIVPFGAYNHAISVQGQGISDHLLFGSVVSTILVVVVTVQVALDTSYWTVFNHITLWGSLLFFFILHYLYNFTIRGKYLGSLTKALQEASFWFTLVLTVMILIIPVLAWRFYFHDVYPTLSDRVQLKQRVSSAKTRQAQARQTLRTPSARRSRRSLRSSYAFAHQEGFGPLITSGKIMRKAKSNNNHTVGSTVASLVSSVTNFGSGPLNIPTQPTRSSSPRNITIVSPQEATQQHPNQQDSVRI